MDSGVRLDVGRVLAPVGTRSPVGERTTRASDSYFAELSARPLGISTAKSLSGRQTGVAGQPERGA
jgi:hypothetical protein